MNIVWIQNAYRKLKSYAYFDKTHVHLRNKIVQFENDDETKIGHKFNEVKIILEKAINKKFYDELESKININFYPKKFKESENVIFTNKLDVGHLEIIDYQAFIDLPIDLHLIGVLWTMIVGSTIDEKLNKDIYGNRIKEDEKGLKNALGSSPYLMKPYFEQYETWRDKGLNILKETLVHGNDAVVINLDLKRFFYQVDLIKLNIKSEIDLLIAQLSDEYKTVAYNLNNIVFQIMKIYTERIRKYDSRIQSECLLPIGFLPSNIISNIALTKFDDIQNNNKPLYYGRYVDDIILVYNIGENSETRSTLEQIKRSTDTDSITMKREILNSLYCKEYWVIENGDLFFKVDSIKLEFNVKKIKILDFIHDSSTLAIDEFIKYLWRTKSEMRLIPEDLSDIDLGRLTQSCNSIKLDGVYNGKVDKFELSRFIGKLLNVLREVDSNSFNDTIDELFDLLSNEDIIDLYLLWESLITLTVLSKRFDQLYNFLMKTINAIELVKMTNEKCIENDTLSKDIHNSLKNNLKYSFYRAVSIISEVNWPETNLDDGLKSLLNQYPQISGLYRKFNMTNKNFVSLVPSFLKEKTDLYRAFYNFDDLISSIDLNNSVVKKICSRKIINNPDYYLFPYNIDLMDIQLTRLLNKLSNDSNQIEEYEDIIKDAWLPINGYAFNQKFEKKIIVAVDNDETTHNCAKVTKIYSEKSSLCKPCIGIGNVTIDHDKYFDSIRNNTVDRGYKRYSNLSESLNTAIRFRNTTREKTDIFVLPEAYVPVDWLSTLIRTVKKNDMAILTGLEHFSITRNKIKKYYNFTVTLFPIEIRNFKLVYPTFHLKVHYAPIEHKELVNLAIGRTYEMHQWRGVRIVPYLCYELASIKDRALFRDDNPDIIVAIVNNPDVEYFSNIIESLSRDLNCFVVQANDSIYGDSRIFQPAHGYHKNLMRFSGGINHTALITKIDLDDLRKHLKRPLLIQFDHKKWKVKSPR